MGRPWEGGASLTVACFWYSIPREFGAVLQRSLQAGGHEAITLLTGGKIPQDTPRPLSSLGARCVSQPMRGGNGSSISGAG